ncbi:MAG: hypothetical protein JXR95_11835 [Deltaproteobacteria bacterium]|nr:hypothetical protein [Deltaproteobacteria bacterium]
MKIFKYILLLSSVFFLFSGCAGQSAKCGNGVTEDQEECDDGNITGGDGCSSRCLLENSCGNGLCETAEEHTCPQDCAVCGNGKCDDGETVASCTLDCYCTNGSCDIGEDYHICPQDCDAECGNEICEVDESLQTCLKDCYCTNGTCDNGETEQTCPQDCTDILCGNGICDNGETNASCPQDCPVTTNCGNGVCDSTESVASCFQDCYCGNGTCDTGESSSSCSQDCPVSSSCGNGVIESPEQCDGTNTGSSSCISLGFDSGNLSCTASCTYDTSGCSSSTMCSVVPQSGCTTGMKCTVDTATTNMCITAGSGAEMTVCEHDYDCQAGLTCAPAHVTLSEGVCRRYCTSKTVYSDNNECIGSAGSACYYEIGEGDTILTDLFLCTAPCEPVTNLGCHPDMRCSVMGLDRNADNVADKYITECVMTSLPSGNCPSGYVCDEGFECFDFTYYGYPEMCYRWCHVSLNDCGAGYDCYSLPDPAIIGGVEYGVCI